MYLQWGEAQGCFNLASLSRGLLFLQVMMPASLVPDAPFRLSFVVQRIVDAERLKCSLLEERLAIAEELLTANGLALPE